MKKLLISGAILSVLAAAPSLAMADIRDEVKTGIDNKRAQIKDTQDKLRITAEQAKLKVEGVRAATSTPKRELKGDVIKVRAEVANKVFDATIERLEKLSDRIQSRIDKIKAEGATTTDAQNFLDAAKTNIADAEAHMAVIKSLDVSTSTASTTARANFETIKAEAKEAREALTEAKQNLQKSLQAIKQWEAKNRSNATTTDSTN